MQKSVLAGALTIILLGPAPAQAATGYECTFGDLKRRVVIYSEPGVTVPCEVHYYKDTEAPGEREVLWHAGNDASYCETRAAEFRVKLTDWGWTCTDASEEPAPVNDELPVDDTDVLEPVTDED